jgi:hypothetical protein
MLKEANMGKFASDEVYELFDELQKLKVFEKYGTTTKLQPMKIDQFRNRSSVANKVTDEDFNAYCCINNGDNYETWGRENAEQVDYEKRAKERADETLSEINSFFRNSTNSKYSQLEAKLVNRNIDYVIVRQNNNDDGQEWYGVELFMKISYK